MFFQSALLAVVAVFCSAAQADYVIAPNSVPLSVRQGWCDSEVSTCPLICIQTSTGPPKTNKCDATHLTYSCVCSNGNQPNVSEYSLTLPYFTCTEFGNQCVKKCGNDNSCAAACRQDNPCGAQEPKRYNGTATVTSPGASSTEGSSPTIFSGVPGATTTAAKKGNSAASLEIGRSYGLVIVLGSMFVGFAML